MWVIHRMWMSYPQEQDAMFKHLFLALAIGWSSLAAAEFDNFQESQGGNGPNSTVSTITITVILSPSDEETTKICGTKTPAAGCYFKDEHGNEIIVIPESKGWDDYYSFCIAGHEVYHAIGANHASGIGCPYPYVDENNVAKESKDKPTTKKNADNKEKKAKKNKKNKH